MSSRRIALIPAGIVFLLLGIGNWITGQTKVTEHEQLLEAQTAPARMQQFEEFTQLSARTNASLLRPLQARSDEQAAILQKLDFYRVVASGGRLVTLLGIFTLLVALLVTWYRRRQPPTASPAPAAP